MKWHVNFDAPPQTYIRIGNPASSHSIWFNAIKASMNQAIKSGLAARGNVGMCSSIMMDPVAERTYEHFGADLRIFVVFPEGQLDDSSLKDVEWSIGRALQVCIEDLVCTTFKFVIRVTPTHTPANA